jgi:enoyl-CoA hydratase/carnithine racemase
MPGPASAPSEQEALFFITFAGAKHVPDHHRAARQVTLFTIHRPDRKNAICKDTALELQAGFAEFDASDQRVAVITGSGNDAFSSGADVSNLPELWRCIPGSGFTTDKPIIAATAGWVVGGAMVLTMMCDLIVAAENTRFSYPEARLGFTGGMIAGLAARIPHKAAMDLMLLGRPMDARRAHGIGLVSDVVATGKQVEVAMQQAQTLAASAPWCWPRSSGSSISTCCPRARPKPCPRRCASSTWCARAPTPRRAWLRSGKSALQVYGSLTFGLRDQHATEVGRPRR